MRGLMSSSLRAALYASVSPSSPLGTGSRTRSSPGASHRRSGRWPAALMPPDALR